MADEIHEIKTSDSEEIKKLEEEAISAVKSLDAKTSDDQHTYDIMRQAVDDSASDKTKEEANSKKWNDDTRSTNWINGKKNISVPGYMQVQHMVPPVTRAIIGRNEYFLLPKRRLPELSSDAQEEITRVHGSQVYPVLDDFGNIPQYAEDAIAIPCRTQNTPRYFESADIEENFTHDDVFRSNVELADGLRESKERNKKRAVL
jgi:hypothetical protein